jgi:hypothetical protein
VQFKPSVPDQRARAASGGEVEGQDDGPASFAHRQDHPSLFLTDRLGGPVNGIEAFGTLGVLGPHFGVCSAQFAGGLNVGEEGAEDGLHRLTMQGEPPFGSLMQILLVGPLGMGHSGLFVRLHAQVPHGCCLHLRRFEAAEEGW